MSRIPHTRKALAKNKVMFLIIFLCLVVGAIMHKVVWFMQPVAGSWCQGPGFVEARFIGYKIQDLNPVKGSLDPMAKSRGVWRDVKFDFVDDPTPYSSKAEGPNEFGVWRWYGDGITEVTLSMKHTDHPMGYPDTKDFFVITSTFGPFEVPSEIQECPE